MPSRLPSLFLLSALLAACAPAGPVADGGASSSSFAQSSSASSSAPRFCDATDFAPDGTMETWYTDAATTAVEVDRPDLGFRVSIPYNPSWGSPELGCVLTPFDEWNHAGEEGVQFGFAGVFEGGGVTRFDVLAAVPARTTDEALEAARNEQERSGLPVQPGAEPTVLDINGNTVVRHGASGFCDETYFEVVGKTRNYSARSVCDVDPDGLRAALETLVLY